MAFVSHQSALNLLQCSPTPLLSPDPASFIFFFPERSNQVSPVSLRKTTHNHCALPITATAKGETKGELIDQPTEDSPPNSLRLNDSISLGIKEPIYEACKCCALVTNDRTLYPLMDIFSLLSIGLRLRDIRSVDPSLWLTNSAPSLLVVALLEVLPHRLTTDVLEQLLISKQTLVELGSRVGALRQMLLDLLDDIDEIRHICIMKKKKRSRYSWKIISKAERLLDFAKEMEDSIVVNLSSWRLEVSRVELLLQVGTFCVSLGALDSGIFGMNLKSYLKQPAYAFWLTTCGIVAGGVIAFFIIYFYMRNRRIL